MADTSDKPNSGKRVEDPERLIQFRKLLAEMTFTSPPSAVDLDPVFEAVDALAYAEVRYYYNLRRRSKVQSFVLRLTALILATLGTLAPLLAATELELFAAVAPWGYVLLALAASFFAANSMFGSTTGHVRFVSSQLHLESLLTIYRLKWEQLKAMPPSGTAKPDEGAKQAFDLVVDYAKQLYLILTQETLSWGNELIQEMEKFRKTLDTTGSNTVLSDR